MPAPGRYTLPNEPTCENPRDLARGHRLLAWLTRRSPYIWPRTRSGALCAYVAHTLDVSALRALPGPLMARDEFGAPPLSWFCLPADQDSLESAMNQELASQSLLDVADTERLMRRVLSSDALHPRRRAPSLPAELDARALSMRVLLIDERASSSIGPREHRSERVTAFRAMLHAVLAECPGAQIWIGPSADAGRGPWLSTICEMPPGDIRKLPTSYSLSELLERFDRVYVIGASEGFGALLTGRPLHVFGRPYYAGWGLSHDYRRFPSRTARPTLSALFHTVFVHFARYLAPFPGQPGTLDDALDAIEIQHEVAARFSDLQHVVGLRFQWWKRRLATPYLTVGGGDLRWTGAPADIHTDEYAMLWGARSTEGIATGVRTCRIEDGFIHSTGLGSDMTPPYSQIIDRSSLYFDPRAPSELTAILNSTRFNANEVSRAAALRTMIVESGITKYNLGRQFPTWRAPAGKRIVLVPGQVADDASILLGTRAITTSDALLAEVRSRRPDAFIVYKPHPDVLSGNRNGVIDVEGHADIVDTDSDIISLIEYADELHTLSSLSGFDALLRNKAVFTYGLPFYAGWGLTDDAVTPQPWRKRTLSLDMLVAGALIRYPIYWNWQTKLYTTPEAVIRQLAPNAYRPLESVRYSRKRTMYKILRWCVNVLSHINWRFIRSTRSHPDYPDS